MPHTVLCLKKIHVHALYFALHNTWFEQVNLLQIHTLDSTTCRLHKSMLCTEHTYINTNGKETTKDKQVSLLTHIQYVHAPAHLVLELIVHACTCTHHRTYVYMNTLTCFFRLRVLNFYGKNRKTLLNYEQYF